jgi:hypothetical protein
MQNEKAYEWRHHRFAGKTRPSLRNGFNGFLRALLGDRACLPPSQAQCASIVAHLTPASGRQDHTTSPSAKAPLVRAKIYARRFRVHRISSPTFVTIASRPSFEDETPIDMPVIWGWWKSENFYDDIWTASITLFARAFFLFRRNGIWRLLRHCERSEAIHSRLITCHSGMRLLAQALMCNCTSENPYSRSWLWIPGSALRAAPE